MTDIFSGVNSRYNAAVVQVSHRMSEHVQFNASYTYSRAVDYGQNEQTFTGTNFLLQPNNIAAEKGTSQFSVPNRFVANAVINSPWNKTGWAGWFANGWQVSPVYQIQNGLPYTASVSGSVPSTFNPASFNINGSGGTNRIDTLGVNTFRQPIVWITDLRLAKHFKFRENYDLELMGDFFNLANKQNVTSVNNLGYSINPAGAPASCTAAAPCLVPNATFQTVTNTNSNFQYTPRQVQLGARFRF